MRDNYGKKTAVALGTFDGLHKGHMAVINRAVVRGYSGLVPVILLFSNHPMETLCGVAPKELLTGDLKQREIEKTGCTPHVVSFAKIRKMTPEKFFTKILLEELNAEFISCGFNFRFGKNGAGDTKILAELCKKYNVELSVAPEVDFESRAVSSTRIRTAIAEGEIKKANEMLGRYFSYDFTVVHGDNRGGKVLGIPTVNQRFPDNFILPKFGVYASFTVVDGQVYPSVTNIGIRPTIGGDTAGSETYIIGFSGDLYGKNPEVGLITYLRDEKKFESLEELSAQMKRDGEKAEEIFNSEVTKIWELY